MAEKAQWGQHGDEQNHHNSSKLYISFAIRIECLPQ
jgi:hypothetical protein